MRDVKDQNMTLYHERRNVYRNGAVTTTKSNFSTKRVFAHRDDVKKTIWMAGFHRPTAYFACEARVTSMDHSSTWERASDPIRREVLKCGLQLQSTWRLGADSNGLPVVDAQVLNRLYSMIRSALADSDLNAGTALGELRESLQTIASLVEDAVSLVRLLKPNQALVDTTVAAFMEAIPGSNGTYKSDPVDVNPDRAHARSESRKAAQKRAERRRRRKKFFGTKTGTDVVYERSAQEYLRFMYGIRPLMADIYAIVNGTATNMAEGEIARITRSLPDETFGPEDMTAFCDEFQGEARREATCSVTFKLASPGAFELWRMGLTDPLSVAWELLTLSFVIDWFLGLGNFIAGLTQPQGITFLHGYVTEYIRKRGYCMTHPLRAQAVANPESYTLVSGQPYARSYVNHVAFRRTPLIGFPIPPVFVRVDLSNSQLVSGLALIVAHLTGNRKAV